MIKGLKFIKRSGKDGRVTNFIYKGYEGWWLTEEYEKATKKDFEDYVERCKEFGRELDEVQKRIDAKRSAMTPEERAGWDEADRAVFERWQDEANTNAILDGYEPEEGEDPDFNPFRKANEE